MGFRRSTLKDVAREAGVSTCTASMALRGVARVAPATRAQVEKVAVRLGYQINNVASLLARSKPHAGDRNLVVAYLKEIPFNDSFQAVCAKGGWLGRDVMINDFKSPEAASRALWNQGVDALILPTTDRGSLIWRKSSGFDWSRFAVVKMSRSFPDLNFTLMRHSAFDYKMMTLTKVLERGYRKIAVLLHQSSSEADNLARLGAVLAFTEQTAAMKGAKCVYYRLRDHTFPDNKMDAATLRWLKAARPDAIVAFGFATIYPLLAAGFKIPEEVGFAAVMGMGEPNDGTSLISGCKMSVDAMLERALGVLEDLVQRGKRGFIDHPIEHVMEPEWMEGETLPWRA